MAQSVNTEKLGSWRGRLAKYESSGLSVAAFCRRERIAPARFYYWARRVREASLANGLVSEGKPASEEELTEHLELLLGNDVRVRIPSSNLKLVAAVLTQLRELTAARSAFERIEVQPRAVVSR